MNEQFRLQAIDEQGQLLNRLAKLCDFMRGLNFAALDKEDQELLERQRKHMEGYSDVLAQRIARFYKDTVKIQ